MDISQPTTAETEKIISTGAFLEIEKFIKEITEKDKIYRLLPSKEMEDLLIEKTNKLVKIFIDFNNEILSWNNESFYLVIQNYADGLNNKATQICLRYNISNIITYCKSYELEEPFKSFFDEKLSVFRKLVHYIEQQKIDMLSQQIINIESSTLVDIIQYSKILDKKVTSLTTSIDEFKKHSTKMTKELAKARNTLGNIMEQALGIIGIFSGIILVFFSGISLIDSFKSMDNMSIYRLTFITILTGAIILNLIFFLMFFISRMSGKSINVICSKFEEIKDINKPPIEEINDKYLVELQKTNNYLESIKEERLCANCKNSRCGDKKCGFLEKIINKYPYVFFVNIAIFFIEIIIIFFWWFKNYILNDYVVIVKNAILTVSLTSVSVIAIFAYFLILIYSVGKTKDWNKNRKFIIIWGLVFIIALIGLLLIFGFSLEKI